MEFGFPIKRARIPQANHKSLAGRIAIVEIGNQTAVDRGNREEIIMQFIDLKKICGLLCCVTLAACGGGGGDGPRDVPDPDIPVTTTQFDVDFSADQVIGAAAAPATVSATASLSTARGDGTAASGSVSVNGVTATAVSINVGYAGENGPVAVALTNAGGGTWNLPAGTELDDDEFFRLDAAGYYVSIETPQGRLRGQIRPPGWVVAMIDMDAMQAVPTASSTGSAIAGFSLHAPTGRLRLRMSVEGITDAIGAALRIAIAGARGNVAIPLEVSASDPAVWGTRDINNPNADDILTTTGQALLGTGSLYFSLETTSHPDGELRGQVVDESIVVVDAQLVDSQVVTSGAPVVSDAEGVATVTWTPALQRLGVAVNTDIDDAVSVTLHQGAPGENGPPILSLMPDVTLAGNWFVGPTEISAEQAQALADGETYVNIVSVAFPEGELRGQVFLDPSSSSVVIAPTVDQSNTQQASVDFAGGTLSLTAANGAQMSAEIPELTVLDGTAFSMTDIAAVSGFPADAKLLAAAQMGPAGVVLAQPVTLTFDVTGLRSPDTVLVGFKTRNDGTGLQLMPVRDALGTTGLATTAMSGNQVSVTVLGFSNIGVVEVPRDHVPTFSFEVISQQPEVELPEKMLLALFNAILDTDLTTAEIDDFAEGELATLIRNRRMELGAQMIEFTERDQLTADDLFEFRLLHTAMLYTAIAVDDAVDPTTSFEEIQSVFEILVTFSEIYGAGLHLQCFVDPAGVEEALELVSFSLLLRIGERIAEENPDISLDDIAARAKEISSCYNEAILAAYFESFNLPTGDVLDGLATGIISVTADTIAGTSSTNNLPDRAVGLQFQEPRLVSADPLTIEFKEASDTLLGIYGDTVRLTFDAPNGSDRTGTIELLDEEVYSVATSQQQQDDGERPFVTYNLTLRGAGTVLLTPTGIDIAYTTQSRETSDGLIENLVRGMQGDIQVFKSFTPRSFVGEIELYE
jgi:hypothetical protein